MNSQAVVALAVRQLLEKAASLTRQDICLECLDRRCAEGRICKEFIRRVKAYAWELASQKAELN